MSFGDSSKTKNKSSFLNDTVSSSIVKEKSPKIAANKYEILVKSNTLQNSKGYNSTTRSKDANPSKIEDENVIKSSYFQRALGSKITYSSNKFKRNYSSKNSVRSSSQKSDAESFSDKIAEKPESFQTGYEVIINLNFISY